MACSSVTFQMEIINTCCRWTLVENWLLLTVCSIIVTRSPAIWVKDETWIKSLCMWRSQRSISLGTEWDIIDFKHVPSAPPICNSSSSSHGKEQIVLAVKRIGTIALTFMPPVLILCGMITYHLFNFKTVSSFKILADQVAAVEWSSYSTQGLLLLMLIYIRQTNLPFGVITEEVICVYWNYFELLILWLEDIILWPTPKSCGVHMSWSILWCILVSWRWFRSWSFASLLWSIDAVILSTSDLTVSNRRRLSSDTITIEQRCCCNVHRLWILQVRL